MSPYESCFPSLKNHYWAKFFQVNQSSSTLLTWLHILFRFLLRNTRRTALVGSSPRLLHIALHFRDRACGRVRLGETQRPNDEKVPWKHLGDASDFLIRLDIRPWNWFHRSSRNVWVPQQSDSWLRLKWNSDFSFVTFAEGALFRCEWTRSIHLEEILFSKTQSLNFESSTGRHIGVYVITPLFEIVFPSFQPIFYVILTTIPDWSPPVTVAAKHVSVGLAWNIIHFVFDSVDIQFVRVLLMVTWHGTDAVGWQEFIFIQHVRQQTTKLFAGRNRQEVWVVVWI